MNTSRTGLGDTWRPWNSARRGVVALRSRALDSTDDVGDLGDKYSDATQDAWAASHWTTGKPIRTRADALVAARAAYLLAASESGRNQFNYLAERAAYAYETANLSADTILLTVINETRKTAPRTSGKVSGWLAQYRRDRDYATANPTAAKSTAKKSASTRSWEVNLPAGKKDTPVSEGWKETARPYLPWVAGTVAVLAALAILFRPSRNAPPPVVIRAP